MNKKINFEIIIDDEDVKIDFTMNKNIPYILVSGLIAGVIRGYYDKKINRKIARYLNELTFKNELQWKAEDEFEINLARRIHEVYFQCTEIEFENDADENEIRESFEVGIQSIIEILEG